MNHDVSRKITQIEKWKQSHEQIVFTNGCFDLVHVGHIQYLQEAKSLGSKLVVGINGDESVAKLKGPGRPINDLTSRIKMLESFRFIDLVIPFYEDTPINLIEAIKPKVLVKGGDYRIENIVGSKFVIQNGGTVKSLKFVKGFSTTELIKRIKKIN